MSTIDEKLNLANENVPKVYNAGGEGKSTATNLMNGDSDYSLRLANATASGTGAVALGCGTSAKADHAFASGCDSMAISEDAIALGKNSIAGSKCFKILSFNSPGYVLDSVEGLEVGDVFSLKLKNDYDNVGEITSIDELSDGTMQVTTSVYMENEEDSDNIFRIPKKPNIGTTDFGVGAVSVGKDSIAAGYESYAEGTECVSGGARSHTEGHRNEAAYCAHAEGFNTKASAPYSHAEGYQTIASSKYQHVQGKYNIEDSKSTYAHIVGNGTSDTERSNAHTLDWDGNAWFAGDVESEKYGKLSEKASTKDVNNTFANALKGSKIGSSLCLDDISPVEHELKVKVSSKNLIPYPYDDVIVLNRASFTENSDGSITTNGITFKDNGDGTITFNGTATAETSIRIKVPSLLPKNKQYVLSGCPNNGSDTTYYMYLNGTYNNTMYGSYTVYDYGNSVLMKGSFGNAINEIWINITICQDVNVENLIFKPQIEEGSAATKWQKYVPENVLSEMQLSKSNANMFNPNCYGRTIVPSTLSCVKQENGTLLINGTSNDSEYYDLGTYLLGQGSYTCIGSSAKTGVYVNGQQVGLEPKIQVTNNWLVNFKLEIDPGTYENFTVHPFLVAKDVEDYQWDIPTGETYTIASDGTVENNTSLSPVTTLTIINTTTEYSGVTITAEYNRDINKAFEELKNAILAQGGNV